MSAINVDMMFVIDISGSMAPCLDSLRKHLDQLTQPLQGYVSKIRFGFVAMSVTPVNNQSIYSLNLLSCSGETAFDKLYQKNSNYRINNNDFFTDDPKQFTKALASLVPQGDEDMLVSLDIAAVMPFGPLSNTKRVIALFSDEPFEGGVDGNSNNYLIPKLIEKLQQRHIQLFVAVPDSDAVQQLSTADRSEIELVDSGKGLAGVNFALLMSQMGKSISGSSMQILVEPPYTRALYGQDKWVSTNTKIDAAYQDK